VLALIGVEWLPVWGWGAAAPVAVYVLALYGKPRDKPLFSAAVVPPTVEKLTDAIVVRALGALGIPAINQAIKDDPRKGIEFTDPLHRDGPGWLANINLPYGVTAGEVMEKRENLASGLRRPLGCVWPETVTGDHPGRLSLWVGYEDMSKSRQPAWELARHGTADLFRPAPFGTDQRGRVVTLTLMFVSAVIGSIPRMGKTFLLRLLCLIAALDPRAELHLYDNKGTGDLAPLECVAHRYRAGDDPEDIEYAIKDLRALREEMRRRTKVIRGLPRTICPESKVTPDLAKDKTLRLHPVVIGVDECQIWFEHPKYGAEFEEICTDLVKRGPALAIILILATQRPDAKSIPAGIKANVVLRLCLKVMGWRENDMVLGDGAHARGVKATMFGLSDKGICYFSGEGDAPRIVRGFYIDAPAAEKIALRARGLRERAGTLSGHALGLELGDEPERSFAADVASVFDGEAALWLETIAARLREQIPETYPSITKEAVGSQLRDLRVTVKDVREQGGANRKGCQRADVAAVADLMGV
jgi:S-DNA-T family DNA segregation ATPase FtsK/SpoIIIE